MRNLKTLNPMKKISTLLLIIFTSSFAFAQLPVSHAAGKKQVLIEDFTGNKCQGCPSGAKAADLYTAAHPGQAFTICIHSSGSFSVPDTAATAKDFRTPDGDAIQAMPGIGITSYPAGMVNRIVPTYPHTPGGLAMYHGFWANEANTILTQNAYVNIAGQAYLHPTTKQLFINIEAYYTANCPVSTNRLSVALLQDNIIAYQKGANNYPAMQVGNDYRHNHVLRDVLSNNALGDNVTGPKTAGTTYTKSINYTVAATYPASGTLTIPTVNANLQLLAWISETDRNVIAVCKIPIIISTSAAIFESNESTNTFSIYPNPASDNATVNFNLKESTTVSVNVVNMLGQTVLSNKLGIVNAGTHNYDLSTADLSKGIYIVNVIVGDKIQSKKISVIK